MDWTSFNGNQGYPSHLNDSFPTAQCSKERLNWPFELERLFSNVKEVFQRHLPKSIVSFFVHHPFLTIGFGITSVFAINSLASLTIWKIRRQDVSCCSKRRQKYKRGTVILHQFQRGRFAPSFSAFPLKLETYLRMIHAPYESCFEEPIGINGICPWITYNGEDVYGAQICIEYLNAKMNTNLNKGLQDDQIAASIAFRILIEDHLYWCIALYQWHYDTTRQINNAVHSNFLFRSFVRPMVARMVRQSAHHHGIGRHSESAVIEMGLQDLWALSRYLECKPYLMGNEPTEVDASLFACLAIIIYNLPFSPYAKVLSGECGNLKDYVRRMKENFWTDWDYCLAVAPVAPSSIDFTATSPRSVRQQY